MDIGNRLRTLRLQRNLTQEEMADRCELSKGFISQVERNLASPSIATLKDMLECLGSSLPAFFSMKGEENIVFSPADMFEKVDDEVLKGTITWLIPDAQKNTMEPILLDIGPGGESQTLPPHEGEEFGYVLKGSVILQLGDEQKKLKAGDSFCLHPSCEHSIINLSKAAARIIWVSTPPSF